MLYVRTSPRVFVLELTRNITVGSCTREAISREIRPVGQFAPDLPYACSPGRNGTSRGITKGIGSCTKISCLSIEAQLQSFPRFYDWETVLFHLQPETSVPRPFSLIVNRFAFTPLICDFCVAYI